MTPGRVIVVGCGVVGAACAHWLTEAGVEVEMLDAGAFGAGCSSGNCGFICPSHVLPLAMPGAVKAALPLIFRPHSPFAVRLRFDPHLWTWMVRFARCCTEDRAWRTAAALHWLLAESRRMYDTLATEMDFELQPRGCYFVHADRGHFEAFTKTSDLLRARFGIVAEPIDGAELVRREPSVVDGLAGAWFFPGDAHMRPDRLMSTWRELLERRGVRVVEHAPVTDLAGRGGVATSATTPTGARSADAFVFATGAWTPRLSGMLGVRLPIVPGKGYSLTSPTPLGAPCVPLIFEDARVAATPMRSGFRLGSTMEFAGYDQSIREARLNLLRNAARRYLRTPCTPTAETAWFGWRPMTPHGLPFIGRVPRWRNVFVAAGHNMIGMATAPATGRLIADLVCGRRSGVDPAPFAAAQE